MSASVLLSRLEGVKRTGRDRWLARCPAHDDRRASLAVKELDDGRVLVHDFARCAVGDVAQAAGLTLADLFPENQRRVHRTGPEARPFPAADVVRAVAHEAMIVAIAASRLGNGHPLTDEDRTRLLLAADRIRTAIEESGHEG